MSTTLMTSESYMLTSESVTEGHPDKLCDQISDGVLDAILAQDPQGRVACETATTTGLVLIAGEITTNSYVDIPAIARDVIRDAGYTRAKYGFDYETCGVIVSIKEQSAILPWESTARWRPRSRSSPSRRATTSTSSVPGTRV